MISSEFLFLLSVFGVRQIVKRDAVGCRQLIRIHVVGNHAGDAAFQFAVAVAIEKIMQAMIEFRHQNDNARPLVHVVDLPSHRKFVRDVRKPRAQLFQRHARAHGFEMHAHEEMLRAGIAILRAIDDVAALRVQKRRHGMNDARLVRARQRQHEIARMFRRRDQGPSLRSGSFSHAARRASLGASITCGGPSPKIIVARAGAS